MKKSMLNVITLALVLINLVLTVLLTFSLVSTNKKTNDLITKIAEIIDLDVGGGISNGSSSGSNINDLTFVDVTNGDSTDIMISFVDGGKTHYAILTVSLGINSKAKDYDDVTAAIDKGMKIIVSKVQAEARNYNYSTISANQTTIENNLLLELQDLFQTEAIESVLISMVIQ